VIDPVPVAVILKFALVPSQIVVLPVMFAVGLGTTLIVPVALVKPVVLDAVVMSFVTLTNV
jgi:NAD-dependent DNA ligase